MKSRLQITSMNSGLIIGSVQFEREHVTSFDRYPFSIPVIKNFQKLTFRKPVTFLIGENGIGKSTFVEAFAVAAGLNPEGGTQNFNFSTHDSHSELSEYFTLVKYRRPRTRFFLRAESFYNVASEIVHLSETAPGTLYGNYGGNLHECSHGESFLKLVQNRFSPNGLYILDEPEAALSPSRQMTLLCLIDDLVKHGSQFIIASHSPILISYRDGEILDLNQNFQPVQYKDTELYQIYKMYLDNPLGMQRHLFNAEPSI